MNDLEPMNPLDRATQERLRGLNSMPVEIGRLRDAVRARVGQPHPGRRFALPRRGWAAIAASVAILVLTAGVFLATSSRPVLASADDLAALHRSPAHLVIPADSMQRAQELLAVQLPAPADLPDAPPKCVRACCVRHIGNRAVATVRMDIDGQSVTLALAAAKDIKCRPVKSVTRNNIEYGIQQSAETTILTRQHGGQWVVLIAALPAERMLDIAEMLKF